MERFCTSEASPKGEPHGWGELRGHRQALNTKAPVDFDRGFFIFSPRITQSFRILLTPLTYIHVGKIRKCKNKKY